MTTEEKAKAYDEALEKAKEMMDNCSFETTKVVCQELFPELVESEDERIINAIIGILKNPNVIDINVSQEKMVAWLEKQKEQKPADDKEYSSPECGTTAGVWSEEDEKMKKTSISFLKDFADTGWENAVECIDWLKSLPLRCSKSSDNWKPSEDQMEADFEQAAEHVYESWMGGTMDQFRRDMNELGRVLNARKEEEK